MNARVYPVSDSELPVGYPRQRKKDNYKVNVVAYMRQNFGVGNEAEALRLGLEAMVAGYDRAISTLPEGHPLRGMIEGSFGAGPKLARMLLGKET